jgi:hypothetical protein
VLNALGGFLAGYGVAAFVCFLGIDQHWMGAASTVPAPSLGAIFPHNEHGYIVYFTPFQATGCALLSETSIPLAMLGALIVPKKNIKSGSGFLSWSATYDQDDLSHIGKWSAALGALAALPIVFILGPHLVNWLITLGLAQRF